MTIGGGFPIDGFYKIKHFEDTVGSQVKVLTHQLYDKIF